MLTGDLLRISRRQGRVSPRLVDPADPAWLGRAEALLAELRAHVGRRRGDLEARLDAWAPGGPQYAGERGLAKLALDRGSFETRAPVDPAALRAAVFDRAAAAWRTRPLADLPRWRAAVLAEAGHAAGLEAGQAAAPGAGQPAGRPAIQAAAAAEACLYADLEANQVLTAFEELSPARLLQRYNVALVQGLLLRADSLEVRAPWPEPVRLRQLFRWLKFFGLLFEARREPDGALSLRVDGPLSVLEHAGRYGVNLAQFFAALLLWRGPWRMQARVRVGRRAQPAELALEPHPWLVSPLPDHGAWVPDAVRDFVAAFNAQPGPWRARPAERVVALPGNAYLIPDFEFVAEDGRRVLLEHVPHADPERIARLLRLAAQAASPAAASASGGDAPFHGYWIACKRADRLPDDPNLIAYRRALLAGPVRQKLEAEGGSQ
jgi:predicted nuclease of restriction endonuclease-like RecB superfamily